ncbi:LIM domain only 4 [Cichlidogyrus casuarinus]|uniref:LIM domain only 4 n=1 Tax=Cichlidogyrus casuarinus TaxID=1844966 RepID=A0ABD2PKX0_9PLAT
MDYQQQQQQKQWDPHSDQAPKHVCAACCRPIEEKTLLDALDRFWHVYCLKCSCCGARLADIGSSFFVKADMFLCREDYAR